ncbi:response regulator [Tolypothrix sp. FACHB-123]|uniref:response regulator n=1 Tax=Tolypothrix sp. FACHB-123 TaxID=2692868 RepID=UPI0016851CA9|nr:response regulator [Tolypothrix sp. FACHB-123]MBD2356985.1 response regulator [Tolypothrix sp. FACHB-123]
MLPEQQQRILGYFIEEARDHLNTIEQGLLNLQSTLNDPEMINEVFRAAHSIKGGAAMLGLSSIQHTSHRLEDCFKILKENPIKVDQKLESLFLGVADTLKALLENLSGPYGLSEETANNLMSETEPVFQWLNQHLELLVQQATNGIDSSSVTEIRPAFADNGHTLTEIFMHRDFSDAEDDNSNVSNDTTLKVPQETGSPTVLQKQENWSEFQTQVMQTLREMLQLFKQGTTPQNRQSLQQCCQQLLQLGEAFNLPKWCNLCKATTNAIANPDNTYLTLAKIVITEIKTAQELVLQGKDAEIVISQQLEVLLSFPEVELFEMTTADLPDESESDLFANHDDNAIAAELSTTTNDIFNDSITNLSTLSEPVNPDRAIPSIKELTNTELSVLFNTEIGNEDETLLINRNLDPKGPEVGIAELNTLADLFEGETPELDETWQQEEILDINANSNLGIDISGSDTEDADSDIADLLSFDEDTSIDDSQKTIIQTEDFSALFGEIFSEKENSVPLKPQIPATNSELSNLINQDLNLDSSNNESVEEFADLLLEYPGDIAPPDVVQDLLGLALDADETQIGGEFAQPKEEAIASTEISNKQSRDLDELFLDDFHDNSLEEITPIKESKLNLPQPESFSLDNLFTEIPEKEPLSNNKSDIGDLFDSSSTIARDFSSSTENLLNFWDEDGQTEQQLEVDASIEQDVAKALEESLFTAANEFLNDSESLLSSAATSFDLEDFDRTILQTDEQIDLILSADAGMDLFADLALTDTTNSSIVDDKEEPVIDINSLLPEQSGVSDGLSQSTPLPTTALPPEALDFTPEFTNQPTGNLFANGSNSVTDLENDLFHIDTAETTVTETSELNLVSVESNADSELNFEELEKSDTPENTIINTLELDLIEESSASSEFDFGELEKSDTTETTVAETSELNLVSVESDADSELNFGEFEELDTAETTVAQTPELDLFAEESDADSELNFEEFEELDTEKITVAETSELNLVAEESAANSELDFGEFEELDIAETTVAQTPELNLVAEESAANSELNFGEFEELDIAETTVAETSELNLVAEESAANSELNFGEFEELDIAETTVAETSELNLVAEESNADSELNFGEFEELDTAETTVAETSELNLVAEESAANSELNFGELEESDITKTTVAETSELNLVAEESTANSELNFGELEESDITKTTVAETSELNLISVELDADSELNLGELEELDTTETTVAETSELNLVAEESTANSELNFGVFEELDTAEMTVAETSELNLVSVESDADSELNFGEFEELDTAEKIVAETSELDLVADESDADSKLNFGELEKSDTPENTIVNTLELDLTEELPTSSELNFGELEESDITETTVVQTPELSLVSVESDASSELNLGEFEELDTTEKIVAETSELNLVAEESVTPLDLSLTEAANLQNSPDKLDFEEISETVADITVLGLVDELSKTETTLQEFANIENLLENTATNLTNTAITEKSVESNIEQTTESEKVTEQDNTVVANDREVAPEVAAEDEFADLETLLKEEFASPIPDEDFAALEALLDTEKDDNSSVAAAPVYPQKLQPTTANNSSNTVSAPEIEDEFGDLEKLLAEADQTISHSPSTKANTGKNPRPSTRRAARFEETMKVPVKQLDDMSNLVGELVVNRNTLEQDQERLRQSLDNLLVQVQQLSDVGARMQELYERSLLEASLLASRKNKEVGAPSPDSNSDRGFSELEMDRFTPFHTLSQEMIEMIVRVRESASDIDFVTEETERVARQFRQVTTQLQEGLTRARMVPFSQAIDRLRRGVRDNAIKYGKQVELVIEGGDTLIDKMILDHLTDPLTHMLNNAIAHGIETPQVRQASSKKPVGEIKIRAFHQGNQTVISVGDDGAGIDTERIKAKALKLGMLTAEEAKSITRPEIYDLLFQSGFSIKDQADEISGRGVGMDVVRSEISEIRGIVNTDSTLGKGTTFTIRLPLTLSICKALCCVSDRARIAFPMDGVEDTLDIPVKNIQETADGQTYIPWRDTVLPFRPLKDILAFNRQLSRGNVYGGTRDDDMVSVVVVRSANNLIALQIDQVLSEQEIVIKQFEGPAPKPLGVAGATVLGDGRIMPIADVLEIIDIFQGRMSKQTGGIWQQKTTPPVPEVPSVKIDPTVLIVDDSITVRELLSLTFNKAGYRVEQARDGQEAWDKLRSGLPCDIVFCDIEMPRCDGLELLSRIQKDNNLNQLPIAMLTSRGADKHRQMAIQLGASGYFTKPYLEEALLEAAVRMLKGEKLIHGTGA